VSIAIVWTGRLAGAAHAREAGTALAQGERPIGLQHRLRATSL